MVSFGLAICILFFSCSPTLLPFPYKEQVPGSGFLPIDGVWELQGSPLKLRIKIEAGRMYLHSNFSNNARYGMIIAKNIRQIDSRKYVCEALTYNSRTRKAAFGSAINYLPVMQAYCKYFWFSLVERFGNLYQMRRRYASF